MAAKKKRAPLPPRPKFRPFVVRDHVQECNGWTTTKDDQLVRSRELHEQLAVFIDNCRSGTSPGDARSQREFDLARTHLEDCAMRITRGITSIR